MIKFQRDYDLIAVGQSGAPHIISYPITCEFTITRQAFSSCNDAHFTLYNIARDKRHDIYKDNADVQTNMPILFAATHQSQGVAKSICFKGNITRAFSYRQGPDIITEIEALDGGYGVMNAQVELPLKVGWSWLQAAQALVKLMPGLSLGGVSNIIIQNSRGLTLAGSCWDILKQIVQDDGKAFIDLEKVYLLKENDVLVSPNGLLTIDSSIGLLNTPRRQANILTLDLIFEPRLIIGQAIDVNSVVQPEVNGKYHVQGIVHSGVISGAIDSETKTSVTAGSADIGFTEVKTL